MRARLLLAAALLAAVARPAGAQDAARRVAAVRDGKVRLSYAATPGVCGRGESVSWHSRDPDWQDECAPGPVRVQFERRGGRTVAIKTRVGGSWKPGERVTDLGTVPPAEASALLLTLAREGGDAADDAIFPAMLAEGVDPWREVLALARDARAERKVRKAALFWVGQTAAEEVTRDLAGMAEDEREDLDVRETAVFALAQRKDGEAVPALIRTARTARSAKIRKSAMFWLGQSEDPRAVAFFEEVLAARR